MKKQILIFICFFIQLGFLLGQDEIYFKNNTKLNVIIIETDSLQTKYKLISDTGGPVKIVDNTALKMIFYENGSVINFTSRIQSDIDSTVYRKHLKDSLIGLSRDRFKNAISLNILDLINRSVQLSFWWELKRNRLAIQIPVSVGYGKPVVSIVNLRVESYDDGGVSLQFQKKITEAGLGLYFKLKPRKYFPFTTRNRSSSFLGLIYRGALFENTYTGYTVKYNVPGHAKYTLASSEVINFKCFSSSLSIAMHHLFYLLPRFLIDVNYGFGMVYKPFIIMNDPADADKLKELEPIRKIGIYPHIGINFGLRL